MNPNPYEAPQAPGPPGGYPYPPAGPPADRTMFVLAAVGAGLASAYWAGLTLLIGFSAASGFQIILPIVLIVLYAVRGVQIFKGDRAAARRILWLHGFGAISAVLQIASGGPLFFILQGIKIAIHIFGGITAYLVQKNA